MQAIKVFFQGYWKTLVGVRNFMVVKTLVFLARLRFRQILKKFEDPRIAKQALFNFASRNQGDRICYEMLLQYDKKFREIQTF